MAGSMESPGPPPEGENSIIKDILQRLELLPELPQTSRDHLYPMEIMLHFEVESYKFLLKTIESDLTLLERATQGEVTFNPEQEEIYKTLLRDEVPSSWEPGMFPSGLKLRPWLDLLEQRVELISVYAKSPAGVAVFNLAAFYHPDRFIQCILQSHSRKSFRDLNTFRLEAQVSYSVYDFL